MCAYGCMCISLQKYTRSKRTAIYIADTVQFDFLNKFRLELNFLNRMASTNTIFRISLFCLGYLLNSVKIVASRYNALTSPNHIGIQHFVTGDSWRVFWHFVHLSYRSAQIGMKNKMRFCFSFYWTNFKNFNKTNPFYYECYDSKCQKPITQIYRHDHFSSPLFRKTYSFAISFSLSLLRITWASS